MSLTEPSDTASPSPAVSGEAGGGGGGVEGERALHVATKMGGENKPRCDETACGGGTRDGGDDNRMAECNSENVHRDGNDVTNASSQEKAGL